MASIKNIVLRLNEDESPIAFVFMDNKQVGEIHLETNDRNDFLFRFEFESPEIEKEIWSRIKSMSYQNLDEFFDGLLELQEWEEIYRTTLSEEFPILRVIQIQDNPFAPKEYMKFRSYEEMADWERKERKKAWKTHALFHNLESFNIK